MSHPNARAIRMGLILPIFSGDAAKVVQAARDAERLGFDGVFAYDHFFPPGGPPERSSLEAFTCLAAASAVTASVAVGTLVTRAVLRPPGLLAKMAATLDLVSGGRMIVGMGTGDAIDAGEHLATGIPALGVDARRVHLAETTAALKALFRGEIYEGGTIVPRIEGPILPAPVRPGGPPVWLGGRSDEVIRIAGSLADGWNGWGLTEEAFRRKSELLAEEAGRNGRDTEATWAGIVLVGADEAETAAMLEERRAAGMPEPSWTGSADTFAGHLRGLARAGATWAIVVLAGRPGRRELLAERVLPALA